MFEFVKKQQVFEVGGVQLGGQPGELPTVLIGSLFHEGHKIVEERKLGIFNKKRAENLINVQDEMSEKTGIPCMLDIVGETSESLTKYIDFVSRFTDVPLLINGPRPSVRILSSRYAVEIGLKDKIIYNSINYTVTDEEIESIREMGLNTAIIQAFHPSNPFSTGMISILKSNSGKEGMLKKASMAGITQPLLFMPVLDVPSIGFAARGIYMAKEEFGLPTGTGPVGVVGRWKKVGDLGVNAKKVCRGGATTITQAMGADFIIYGSVAKARNIFPVCAMIDSVITYNAKSYGIRPITRDHPIYTIF